MVPEGFLNVADYYIGTRTLGPGFRAVIWVQGCHLSCPECIAPEWKIQKNANLMNIDYLASLVINNNDITGITISGGEPMLQAMELTHLILKIRKSKNVNVICFSGFKYEVLIKSTLPGVMDLLKHIDVLIDGPYIKRQNDGIGLRGSRNQNIVHLTDALKAFDFYHNLRKIEIHIRKNDYLLIGIPPNGILTTMANVNNLSEYKT